MRLGKKRPSVSINFTNPPEMLKSCNPPWKQDDHYLWVLKTTSRYELSGKEVRKERGFPRWFGRVFPLVGWSRAGLCRPEWLPIVKGQVIMAYLPYWLLIPCQCWLCLYSFPLQPEDLGQIKRKKRKRKQRCTSAVAWHILTYYKRSG